MRDILPNLSARCSVLPAATPWSTYVPCTPSNRQPARTSLTPSPSPVKRSNEGSPETPTSDVSDYPHCAHQLPFHENGNRPREFAVIEPKLIFEQFISDMSEDAKARVRNSYNGPTWPNRVQTPTPRLSPPPAQRLSGTFLANKDRTSVCSSSTSPKVYISDNDVFGPATAYRVSSFNYFSGGYRGH